MSRKEPFCEPGDELICLGHDELLSEQFGAMAPPVVQTSLFAQESHEQLMAGLAAESRTPVYTRGLNPTVAAVESKLARLERAEACKCVASGMAAVSAVLHTFLRSGDHVLCVNHTYGPTLQLAEHLERFGVSHDLQLEIAPDRVEAAIRPETRVVWVESPGTMLFRTLDLPAIAGVAREAGALTVVDNSWASPLFQKPLDHGADLVVHSATKYIGGHSDVVAGALAGRQTLIEQVFQAGYLLGGGALGPWDAFLLNRGLRTLPGRMRQHHHGALAVAAALGEHPAVARVFHPCLDDKECPTLSGYSGLLSFELADDSYDSVRTVVNALERFRIGVSWGGVESLVLAPNRGDNREQLGDRGIPPGLIRLSVGLEPPTLLIEDLHRALGIRER